MPVVKARFVNCEGKMTAIDDLLDDYPMEEYLWTTLLEVNMHSGL